MPPGVHPYVDEVLVGATDNVVVRHGDRVHTATRCLQDVDAVEGPDIPDLWASAEHLVLGRGLWGFTHVGSPPSTQAVCEGVSLSQWEGGRAVLIQGGALPPGRGQRGTLIVW